MKRLNRPNFALVVVALAALVMAGSPLSFAADTAEIENTSKTALAKLVETNPTAAMLKEKAEAVLVFPSILKAGLIVGGQGGQRGLVSRW